MDPRTATRKFEVSPCVMLVALRDGEADLCSQLIKELTPAKNLAVMRVAHIRAACERMLVTRPLVVVYSEALAPDDRKLVKERSEDIGAEGVLVPMAIDTHALQRALARALREAGA